MVTRYIRTHIRFYSILLVALPVLTLLVVSLFLFRNMVIDRELTRLKQHVAYQQLSVDSWLHVLRRDVAIMADTIAVRQDDAGSMLTVFTNYLDHNTDVAAVVRVDRNGYTQVDTASSTGVFLGDREYFTAGRNGTAWVSDVLIGRTSGTPIVIFSHPVFTEQGDFDGVVCLAVRMSTVQNLLNTLAGVGAGESYLINAQGEMLTESQPLHEMRSKELSQSSTAKNVLLAPEIMQAAFNGTNVTTPYTAHHGETVMGAVTVLNNGTWGLLTEVPQDTVLQDFHRLIWVMAGLMVGSFLLFFPLLLRFSNSIQKPVDSLVGFTRAMAAGKYSQECSMPDVAGAPEEVRELYTAFCDMNQKITSTIDELERVSITDQLTGVFNRRYLMLEGDRVVEQCVRSEKPCSCLMLDIDHFKQVNDTYGHATGDRVLVAVARIISEAVRNTDIVSRYGGEEFAVVAPNADRDEAAILGERIRIAVENEQLDHDGEFFSCTISVGVSDIDTERMDGATVLESALNCADKQLCKAKADGRNRIVSREDC